MNNTVKNRFKRLGSRVSSLLRLYMSTQTDPRLIRDLVDRLIPHDLGIPLRRVGGYADGGYLLPDDLDDLECCFSPGVADTAAFEKDLYDMGIRSYLADYSVAGPPAALPDCDFEKKFVGAVTAGNVITLDDWVAEKCPPGTSRDLILQMDIEGAEYETILATSPETLSRFRIIVIELHKFSHLGNRLFYRFVHAAISKLLDQFEIAHLHANNAGGLTPMAGIEIPRVAELTFLRKDRVVKKSPVAGLPHVLDAPNVPEQAELILPPYWWNPDAVKRAA